MIYLASPYSHRYSKVMEERFRQAELATYYLLKDEIWTYSPIVHCHALAQRHNLPTDFDFWSRYNYQMLELASIMLILDIPGWWESKGVTAERAYWADLLRDPPRLLRFADSTVIICSEVI